MGFQVKCEVAVLQSVQTLRRDVGKRGNGEFQRFLQIASGSASELDYHLLLARDLHFLRDSDYRQIQNHLSELRRMLTSLIKKVELERLMTKC